MSRYTIYCLCRTALTVSLPLLNPQSTSNFGDTQDDTLGSLKLTAVWKDLGPGQGVFGDKGWIPLHS